MTLAFASPSAASSNLLVVFALRGPDGNRFADGLLRIDGVPGKSSVLKVVSTETSLPEWLDRDEVVCEVMTIETLDDGLPLPQPTPTPVRDVPPRQVPGTACTILERSVVETPLEVEFVAPNREAATLRIDYGLFDDAGALVWTERDFLRDVQDGEVFRFRPPPLMRSADGATNCKVTGIEQVGTPQEDEAKVVTPDDACSIIGTDSFGYLQVQFAFDNRFSAGEEITASATLRHDDGARLGDVTEYRFLASAGAVLEPTSDTWVFGADDDVDDLTCEVTWMDRSGSGLDFVPVEAETPESSSGACRYVGVNSLDEIRIELEFTNPLDIATDAEVSFAVFDGGDSSLMSGSEYLVEARPGDRFRFWLDTVPRSLSSASDDSQITCKLIDVVPLDYDRMWLDVRADSICEVIGIEDNGDFAVSQLRFEMTIPLSSDSFAVVPFTLVGPDGVRFHSDEWFVEQVSPDRSVIAVDTVFELPDWVSAVDVTCEILGVEDVTF